MPVLTLPPSVRFYVALEPIDMRKQIDGLAGAARLTIGGDPLSGHVFLFFNRRRTLVKGLYWDRSGYCMWVKRLEKGTFSWPRSDSRAVELGAAELSVLLGGFDLARARRRAWYDRAPSE